MCAAYKVKKALCCIGQLLSNWYSMKILYYANIMRMQTLNYNMTSKVTFMFMYFSFSKSNVTFCRLSKFVWLTYPLRDRRLHHTYWYYKGCNAQLWCYFIPQHQGINKILLKCRDCVSFLDVIADAHTFFQGYYSLCSDFLLLVLANHLQVYLGILK